MKIFVFTGGGLSPTLNPSIYGVVSAARQQGWSVMGGMYGWASLLEGGKQVNLDTIDLEPLKNVGGTLLRSSRTNPLAVDHGIAQVKARIKELGIDAVVAIGGNDTLGAAAELAAAGVPVVGIPKTIDNDLAGTYTTPGYTSAAHYLSSLTREIKEDAAYALSRIFVIESLGMKAGWLAAAGIFGGADIVLPPEEKVNFSNFLKTLNDRYTANGNYAVVVVSQEAQFDRPLPSIKHIEVNEQYGHERRHFVCLSLTEAIQKELRVQCKAIYPGNFLETGLPTDIDRDLSIALGKKAVDLIAAKEFGAMAVIDRIDKTSHTLTVGSRVMQSGDKNKNYRPFPKEFFDYTKLLPTKAFIDYAEPLLGPYEKEPTPYQKLIKNVTSQLP